MLDDGLPVVPPAASPLGLEPAVVVRAASKALFDVVNLGAALRVALLMIVLLPVLLVICLVAVLVPFCLRVPVCGPSRPRIR